MRVIAGEARGLRLEGPGALPIRPTLDRVRESLFNMLAPRLAGSRFLDLFAGTGANGIEALSRGAVHAAFVDASAQALALIRRNLAASRLRRDARCVQATLPAGLSALGAGVAPYDIVFADPPHTFTDYAGLVEAVAAAGVVAAGGRLIVEHDSVASMPEGAGVLHRTEARQYGRTTLTFYA